MNVTVRGNGGEINPQRKRKYTKPAIQAMIKKGQPSGWQGQTKGPG